MNQQPLCMNDCTEKVIRYYSDMVYRLAFARTGVFCNRKIQNVAAFLCIDTCHNF